MARLYVYVCVPSIYTLNVSPELNPYSLVHSFPCIYICMNMYVHTHTVYCLADFNLDLKTMNWLEDGEGEGAAGGAGGVGEVIEV